MRALFRFSALVIVCVVVALWSSSLSVRTQSAPSYGVTDLGTLGGPSSSANAITSGGFPVIYGSADVPSGQPHAFRGNPWQLNDEGTLGGPRSTLLGTSPYGGTAVGWSDTATGIHAIVDGSPLRDLGTLGGTTSSAASANDNHLVVGYADIAGDTARHAFIYDLQAGTMSDLGASLGGANSSAAAINSGNHVAGYADIPGNRWHHAFFFSNGTTTDLGAFGTWSEAYAMNGSDVVVGAAGLADGSQHAFIYSGGALQDLGTLGGQSSAALSINNAGVIVGWSDDANGNRRAVIWQNGVIRDLNDMIPPGTGWVLQSANAIQLAQGTAIVGQGTINGATHAFMLTPPNDFSASLMAVRTLTDTNFPNPIEAGQGLTFAASISSNGPYSVTGIVFTQTFTGPVEVTGWRGADSCTQPAPQQVVCRRRAADFDWEVDVFARPTAAGVFTHSISITADQPDPNLSNNSRSESNLAVSLQSLTTGQTTLIGGQQSPFRATITSPAPQGDARVTLASSNPSVASVPNPFDVLAGCCDNGTWREFYVTTYPVSTPTTVQISATYGLVTKTVPITVIPAGTAYPYSGSPSPIPGTIEAENYDVGGEGVAYHDLDGGNNGGAYRSDDVDIEATTDAGSGYDVGWIGASEWLAYTVNVASTGTYQLDARVASPGAGGTFHVEFDGVNKTGTLTVPNTGGWQAWQTVSAPVSLAAGTHTMRVSFDSNGATGAFGNLNWIRLTAAAPSGSTPFGGTARALPGTIQAEDFDNGGQNVAYYDSSAGNNGGQYRSTDVDLESTTDAGGGLNVGWIVAGEWLNYSVAVASAGSYTLDARVASQGPGGTFHVEMDGTNLSGTMTIPDTGAWQSWITLSKAVTLPAGSHVLRVVFDTNGAGGAVGNLNWVRLSPASSGGSTPFSGQALAIPGRIEAENFDNGGEGVAYHDSTAGNSGGQYRSTDVDIEATTDTGGGYNVGWMTAGEWLAYTLNVQQAGTYAVRARVAANGPGGTFHLEVNGNSITGPLTIPNTGGWQSWTDVTASVSLSAGIQTLKLVEDANGSTGVFGNVNYLDLVSSTSAAPSNIVLYGTDFTRHGAWALQADGTAAGGQLALTPDNGWSTADTPLAAPADYLETSFPVTANTPYAIWLRLRATNDSKYNDSVWVQFSGAQSGGSAVYPIGTTSGLLVNLEACSGCGDSGWGWQNGAYWLSQATTVSFPASGTQTIRIQVREDGAQIDQVVLSPSQYISTAPGANRQDSTIVPK